MSILFKRPTGIYYFIRNDNESRKWISTGERNNERKNNEPKTRVNSTRDKVKKAAMVQMG